MKHTLFICLLVAYSSLVFAQKDAHKIESAIVGIFNGLSLVNTDTLRFYSTPDFHLLENGEVWNLDTLINKVSARKNSKIVRINNFDFIQTERKGKMAWVTYHNSALFKQGEKQQTVNWLESAVLVKKNGRWRVRMLHSTLVK